MRIFSMMDKKPRAMYYVRSITSPFKNTDCCSCLTSFLILDGPLFAIALSMLAWREPLVTSIYNSMGDTHPKSQKLFNAFFITDVKFDHLLWSCFAIR